MQIKTTDIFEKALSKLYKKDKHLLNTLEKLTKDLQENPHLGTHLGSGRHKIRIANRSNNKGKSAGYRVVTYVEIEDTILLVYIYSKSKTESIAENKIDEIIANYLA